MDQGAHWLNGRGRHGARVSHLLSQHSHQTGAAFRGAAPRPLPTASPGGTNPASPVFTVL